ncbi:MAG: LysR family transcriptional regulator [Planctomycetota bacterium]|jgi:LysR family transcriptional activator of nhaA
MDWLNYHHLRYFHAVAREGSIARASRLLHTSPPTISVQLQKLEEHLGTKLLVKQGRGLALTDAGAVVRDYADRIFSLGSELVDAVRSRTGSGAARVRIGVADSVPKELAARLLEPLFQSSAGVRATVHEGPAERLLADLALHAFDLVLLDEPPPAITRLKVFQHELGAARIGVFGAGPIDARTRRRFPGSLDGAPFVLPVEDNLLRREFEGYCRAAGLRVRIVAEVEDSALAKTLARDDRGLLLAPIVLANTLRKHYGLRRIGELDGLVIPYVACTVAQRVDDPQISRVLERARDLLEQRS